MPSASAAPLDVLRRRARTDAGGAIGREGACVVEPTEWRDHHGPREPGPL